MPSVIVVVVVIIARSLCIQISTLKYYSVSQSKDINLHTFIFGYYYSHCFFFEYELKESNEKMDEQKKQSLYRKKRRKKTNSSN